jgi:hypothetical protein
MGEVEGNLRGILKQIAAVFYVVEDRDRKGRIDLPKDLSRRPETDGSISSVNVPKARRSNDDRNIRVQTESVAHFQKSLEAIGRLPCFIAVSLPGFERCTCFGYNNVIRCTDELVVANGDYCTSFTICVVLLLITLSRHANHDGYSTAVRIRDDTLITAAA